MFVIFKTSNEDFVFNNTYTYIVFITSLY